MGSQETMPRQTQSHQPGSEAAMHPRPEYRPRFAGSGRLDGKVALITGGDSGIGRAVAVLFAREGADVAIVYLEECDDARETAEAVRGEGRECLTIGGDIGSEEFCGAAVRQTIERLGRLDVLVNNAAEQHEQESIADIGEHQLRRTFQTNVFGYFFMTKAVLPHLPDGAAIVNTTSVTAFKGSPQLLDYSSTRGAIVAFTRSLAQQLADRGIRVNGVAPGPIWTPLIPATMPPEKVKTFGKDVALGRAGQPAELAPVFVLLASEDASYITGTELATDGGYSSYGLPRVREYLVQQMKKGEGA